MTRKKKPWRPAVKILVWLVVSAFVATLFFVSWGMYEFYTWKHKESHLMETGRKPMSELSAELKQITNHDSDYSYSAPYKYPQDIYNYRKMVADNTYDEYIKERFPVYELGLVRSFQEDEQVYQVALKIGDNQDVTDEEIAAIKDRINKRYNGAPLLQLAVNQYNLQAIDKLFKYGADPYMSYSGGAPGNKPKYINFIYEMHQTFHPGFSVDATRLYLKHGYDPDHVGGYGTKDNSSFLHFMMTMNIELAWVDMLKAGANPWHRINKFGEEISIVADAAGRYYYPFIDYIIANNYLSAASEEEIWEVLNALTDRKPYDDLITTNNQRIIREILSRTGIKPTEKIIDYLIWQPPAKPKGYRNSPNMEETNTGEE